MEPFTSTPQHCVILSDISLLSCLLSAAFQAPSTFEEVLLSECLFRFNPLTPKSDYYVTAPYNIHTLT